MPGHSPSLAPQHATHAFVALAAQHLTRVETELLYQRLLAEIRQSEEDMQDARQVLLRLLKVIRASMGNSMSRWEALNLAEQAALDVAEARRRDTPGNC